MARRGGSNSSWDLHGAASHGGNLEQLETLLREHGEMRRRMASMLHKTRAMRQAHSASCQRPPIIRRYTAGDGNEKNRKRLMMAADGCIGAGEEEEMEGEEEARIVYSPATNTYHHVDHSHSILGGDNDSYNGHVVPFSGSHTFGINELRSASLHRRHKEGELQDNGMQPYPDNQVRSYSYDNGGSEARPQALPFEAWAKRKDEEMYSSRSRAQRERQERMLKEEEEKMYQEERRKEQRELSLKRFLQRAEEREEEKRKDEEAETLNRHRKEKMEDERRRKGMLAYERWLADHHIFNSTDHTHALTPCKPSLRNKGLSFETWLSQVEERQPSSSFLNPHPWVDPIPTQEEREVHALQGSCESNRGKKLGSSTAVRDGQGDLGGMRYYPFAGQSLSSTLTHRSSGKRQSSSISYSATHKVIEEPHSAGGIVGVRVPKASQDRQRLRLKPRPKKEAPLQGQTEFYQDPSPPLLWRDRELIERIGKLDV